MGIIEKAPPRLSRLLTVLHIIRLLRSSSWTSRDLAKELGWAPRTIRRHIQLIEAAGIPVEQDMQNRFFIPPDYPLF